MSLLRTLPTKALPLLRTRPFSTSPYVSRSVVEGTKDVVDAVNRSVGKGLKKGIETGGQSSSGLGKNCCLFPVGRLEYWNCAEAAAEAAKSTIGLNTSEAKGSASEVAGETKGKAQEVAGQAKGKASELAGKTKGKASNATDGKSDEIIGETKGKASELLGKAKGTAADVSGQARGKAEEVKSKY